MDSFEKRPLSGKRILITRTKEQASLFSAIIEKMGGIPVFFPTIKIVPPDSRDNLDKAIENIATYDWILFTSSNGVRFFVDRFKENGKEIRVLNNMKVCAIGPGTAKTVNSFGIHADLLPKKSIAESVIESLKAFPVDGTKYLLPRATAARETIPEELTKLGGQVCVAETYKTVRPEGKTGEIRYMLKENRLDVITFTSASTVKNFMEMLGEITNNTIGKIAIACIGPITSKAVEQFGLKTDIMPDRYTVDSLALKIEDFFKTANKGKGK